MRSRHAVQLVSLFEDGHRREFAQLLSREMEAQGISVEIASRIEPFLDLPLLFPMIEDSTMRFVAVALVRSIMNRRTVGFLFRPGQCVSSRSPRHTIKRLLFRVVSQLRATSVLTILPHDVDARFRTVSSDWIFDPQLWDLHTLERGESQQSQSLRRKILAAASGRKILLALGLQNAAKGFHYLSEIAATADFPRDRIMIVAAGKVAPSARAAASRLVDAGAMVIDCSLTDEEFIATYSVADHVWCCYAPEYDQASGIFGRAFQLGVPAVVRAGSYLSKLATLIGHPVVEISDSDANAASGVLAESIPHRKSAALPQYSVARMRDRSLSTLMSQLNFT